MQFEDLIAQYQVTDKEYELMKQAWLHGWLQGHQEGFNEGYERGHEHVWGQYDEEYT